MVITMLNHTERELKNSIQPMNVAIGASVKSTLSHCKLYFYKNIVYTKSHSNKFDLVIGKIQITDNFQYMFIPENTYNSMSFTLYDVNVTSLYYKILIEYIKFVHTYWDSQHG